MSKARLVITAVIIEKRPVSEVASAYGVARSWIYTLLARYRAEGEAAFEPRSRRPKSSPSAISEEAAGLIVRLRKDLSGQGLDAAGIFPGRGALIRPAGAVPAEQHDEETEGRRYPGLEVLARSRAALIPGTNPEVHQTSDLQAISA